MQHRLDLETLDPDKQRTEMARTQGMIELLKKHLSEEYLERLGVEYQQEEKTNG